MADARGQSVQVRLGGRSSAGEDAEFATSGKTITFPGFLRAYVEGSDDPDAELEDRRSACPPWPSATALQAVGSLEAKGHSHPAPARYTEASLVKALEDIGVGRPSTYASIIDTIQDRGYVWKKGTALVPSWTAFAVVGLLEQYFAELVDYGFTASMEDDLDEIAQGRPGDGAVADPVLLRQRATRPEEAWSPSSSARSTPGRSTPSRSATETAWSCGSVGTAPTSSGATSERSDPRGPGPRRADRGAGRGTARAPGRPTGCIGTDPETGLDVMVRAGRFGPYVQLGEADEASRPAQDGLAAARAWIRPR